MNGRRLCTTSKMGKGVAKHHSTIHGAQGDIVMSIVRATCSRYATAISSSCFGEYELHTAWQRCVTLAAAAGAVL
eukprot:CAMPEP_0175998236 /NCGR_PEP_ID=MMETSP0108-20121206/56626_1 /TAXON_ID=195067 ORGANISM="Goniomonas pacifica, Strain CCMP1869" /NCGR_SAMPLE_ID=MMETSP0108 /ASSEMBLY_ACC=CAM_ASM_000204 /LENGTH=74 /DNA_ID=CAMNT_0017330549 /DNA_START=176 /DNA_END=400 /DNA_ORIENTATION=+